MTTAVARNSVLASLALTILTAALGTAVGRTFLTQAGTAIVESVGHLLHPHYGVPWLWHDRTDSESF